MAFDFNRALSYAEGKALPVHPALMSDEPTSVYSPGANRTDSQISQRNAGRHGDAYGGGQAIDWVYDCVNLYADALSTAPYTLKKKDGTKLVRFKTKGTPPDYEVGPKGLYDLLDAPNPFMMYDELLSLLLIDLLLVGNGYWFKWRSTSDGKPLALYRLAPSHVKIIPGAFGPMRYEYQPPGAKDPLKIDPQQIIHFRRPNPHSAYYGMGVIQGAGRSMDLELAVTNTTASYYENKADPSMIVQSERRVPRDVFNKLRAQLRSRTSGAHNAGELLVLEAGLKASSLSTTARDALFAEVSRMSRDRVYAKFRANPMLFGLMDETSGANKVSDVRREFDNSVLVPFATKLQRLVSANLAAAWDADFVIDYRYSMPPDEAVKVAGEVAKIPGIKVREVRSLYSQFGIEESTGDPEIDEMVLNLPGENLGPDGQPVDGGAGFADQPLPGEPGRPPLGTNTKPFSTNLPAGSKVRKPQGKALADLDWRARLSLLPEGKAVSTPAPDNRLPGEQRPSDTFAAARTVDIDNAQGFILSGLREATTQLERDLLDVVEGKAFKTSDIVGRIQKSAAWTTFRERVAEVLEEGARRAASSGVMHSNLIPDDEVDYDAIVKSVVFRPEGLRSILGTIRERVVNRVKDAREADAERGDYEAAVRAVLSEWSDSQALTIADTEATHAYNEATLVAAEMSGVTQVFVTDGDEHDEPCIEADGQVWDIGTARERRIEHPRCRRAFLPLTASSVA